jgi:hypothetical protein
MLISKFEAIKMLEEETFGETLKIIGLLILTSVCNSVQQNITMRKIKRQIFC